MKRDFTFLSPFYAKSARFGGKSMTLEQYNTAIKYWESLGYKVEAMGFNVIK